MIVIQLKMAVEHVYDPEKRMEWAGMRYKIKIKKEIYG